MADAFLDRLREGICEPADVDVEALKAAAASASTELDPPRSLALVRLAYGRPVDDEARASVLGRLNSKGVVVAERGNEQLLAVLAGEALVNSFARTGQLRALTAGFAVRCARHLRWQPVHPDVETHAEAYISARSVAHRTREAKVPAAKASEAEPEGSIELAFKDLRQMREFVLKERQLTAESEAFTWWLLDETRAAHPLAIAQELFSLLRYVPEPLATDELLTRKLRCPATATDAGTPVAVHQDLTDLCPHLAAGEPPQAVDEQATVRVLFDQLQLNQHYAATRR
jgi:hypothetical protein